MTDSVDLAEIETRYEFPPNTGSDRRLAIIEPSGGFHISDLDVALPGSRAVAAHSVTASVNGLPLTGHNSPLHIDTIDQILDALADSGDVQAVAEQFEKDSVWTTFMATLETTLDVQIARALVPDADIDVWFTPTHASGIAAGINGAVKAGATAISISWGQSESDYGSANEPGLVQIEAALQGACEVGVAVCCASGDYGSLNEQSGGDGLVRVNYPASSPWALACGATMSAASGTEAVWNATEYELPHASGGGYSGLFARSARQAAVVDTNMDHVWVPAGTEAGFVGRAVPDVAADAGNYDIVLGGRAFAAGGTSASAPIWAALLTRLSATLDTPIGTVADRLYAAHGKGCTPIIVGDNTLGGALRSFSAAASWDACTGWGTPRGDVLAKVLAPS